MKRFSAPPGVYADPSRPPDDDDSDASSVSDGSKKVKTAQSFESLFNSEALSDIVLDVNAGEYVFHAHKMIVGLKSERLAALITSAAAVPPDNSSGKPVLYLQEPAPCSAVFSRFLYFIYSGAVWLHRDYVIPLFRLSDKYGVGALATHCENYIQQILAKMLGQDPAAPLTQAFSVSAACDLCEEAGYRQDTRDTAFRVLCVRFVDLTRTERWIGAAWQTVRDLLRSDDCTCDENLILVSATDWMKRNKLQDKARIQEILSSIRYPRLPRRVLYHLHATASFKKFPPVQELIEAAIRFHCFRDVPEAQAEFTGLQYRARGGVGVGCNTNTNINNCCSSSRNGVDDGDLEDAVMCTAGIENNSGSITLERGSPESRSVSINSIATAALSLSGQTSLLSTSCQFRRSDSCRCCGGDKDHVDDDPNLLNSNSNKKNNNNHSNISNHNNNDNAANLNSSQPTLPLRERSRSQDRQATSPHGDGANRMGGARHPQPHRHGLALESCVSSFHSPCSPVAAVPPRVQGQSHRNSPSPLADTDAIDEDPPQPLPLSPNDNNRFQHHHHQHQLHHHQHQHHLRHQHQLHESVSHSHRHGGHKNK